jgi:hypothetical protein
MFIFESIKKKLVKQTTIFLAQAQNKTDNTNGYQVNLATISKSSVPESVERPVSNQHRKREC